MSALALIAATGPGASASASDEHARVCKCGPRCRGGACCCAPKSTPKPPPPAASEPDDEAGRSAAADPEPLPEPSGPCLAEAPCGEDATPTKFGPSPTVQEALAEALGLTDALAKGRLPLPASDRPSAGDADRLVRPPKAGVRA